MIALGILLHWVSKTVAFASDSNPLFIFFRHSQNYGVPSSLIITCLTDKLRGKKYAKHDSKK